MTGNRVLVDTSVWITYFKNTSSELSDRIETLMVEAEICVPKIVLAELIQGSKSEREIRIIEGFMGAFTIVDEAEDSWVEAGKLAYQLRKKGKTVNLADCYIATIAHQQNCSVFTLDEHFRDIRTKLPLILL